MHIWKLKKYNLLLMGVFIIFFSCSETNKVQVKKKTDLSDIYNPSRSSLHPDYSIKHINDSASLTYIRLFPAELVFNEANEERESRASITINYRLYHIEDESQNLILKDSSTIQKFLYQDDVRNSYFTALPLKAYYGSKYILQVSFRDNNRSKESRKYLIIDKTSRFNRQNFSVLSARTNYPAFSDIFATGENFKLNFNQFGYDSIYVDYYSLDRTLPRPIFSAAPEIQMKTFPDSSYALPYNDSVIYNLPKTGIFLFKMQKESNIGCTLFNFGESFPKAQTTDDLLWPLVYLSSTAEFRDLRLEPNRKLAIDNYWLKMASDMDDARELIRVYYNRVLFSNLYFSSYKEGWKTDRGMIYIIFGPPDMLDISPDLEIWKYRTRKSSSPLEFRFDRKDNMFSYEDYQLDRRSSSTAIWAEAVQSWKRGKIYSANY